MTTMQARVSMIALGVADLKAAIRFYEQGLGWTLSAASKDSIAFFQLAGGVVLSLYPRDLLAEDACLEAGTASGFGGVTLAQNVESPEAVDAVLALAESAGAKILKTGRMVFWGGYSGYFADLDGHPWEIAWNPAIQLKAEGGLILPG